MQAKETHGTQYRAGGLFPSEQRKLADRRTRPTSFWNAAFRFRGRRAGFRRSEEGYRAYVDQPSRRVVFLALFIMLASIGDAVLTLIHLENGGSEANPVMALLLRQSATSFVGVKMSLTGIATWLLAAHELFPLSFQALHGMAVVYGFLLIFHGVLLLG
jgi:Domain of unknown function (DUF5658)